MKCKKCGGRAVISMPQHHLGLCKEHFDDWILKRTERSIKKYALFTRDDRILVAISGGKDSLSLWDILHRLDYKADGLYIDLGIDGSVNYSVESTRFAQQFAKRNGYRLHVVDIHNVTGKTIPGWEATTLRGKGRACSICGLIKRHEMNHIARKLGYDVLATGHNLDDEAAVLLGNTIRWAGDYLRKQGPVHPGEDGLTRKVKPLCRFYEREMTAYALLRSIDYIYAECPYSVNAPSLHYKAILNQLENSHPGTKQTFYLNFLDAKAKGLFFTRDEVLPNLHPCDRCGQPTSAPDRCSFCRMIEAVNPDNALFVHNEHEEG
jgi:tRNA-5-methyluridine54 2-sulfurtransferase